MKKVSIMNKPSCLMFAALFGSAILFSHCGGSSIGKQAAEDLCECYSASGTDRSGGFAALFCIGAWTEKYEEYLDADALKKKKFIFKDKNIQKEFEKFCEKCKNDNNL